MQINYYLVVFVVSLLILIWYTISNIGYNVGYAVWVLFIVMLTNFGYYIVSISTTVHEAVIGTTIAHLDGTFLICSIIIEQMRLCKIKVPQVFVAVAFSLNLFMLVTIWNTEVTGLYYTSISLAESELGRIVTRENGELHYIYYLLLTLYFAISVYLAFYSLKNKKHLSKYVSVKMFTTIATCFLIYAIEMLFDHEYSILPIGYLVLEIMYVAGLDHINLYDVEKNISLIKMDKNKANYVFFDTDRKYIGSQMCDYRDFPEIEEMQIDNGISADDEKLWKWFGKRMEYYNDSNRDNEVLIEKNSKIYSSRIERLADDRRKLDIGYAFKIIDDTEHQQYISLINDYNHELEDKVSNQVSEIFRIQNKIVNGLATVIEERDLNTGGHINRTTETVRILIETIQRYDCFEIDSEKANNIIHCAHLHDLGKICISDVILNKPGRLDSDEFEIIKGHAKKSGEIVKKLLEEVENKEFVDVAYNIARSHHERWDGKGYPDGLVGEQIPVEARIMAVADVYDALVSKRCYKDPMGFNEAATVIYEEMGTHFDPSLEEVFRLSRKKLESFYQSSS